MSDTASNNSQPISQDVREARDIAQNLNHNYPGWTEVAPDCPCTEPEIRAMNDVFSPANYGLSDYHPGAESGYRSESVGPFASSIDPTLPSLEPGQQCTYHNSFLITDGPGAGTSDAYSPSSLWNVWDHRVTDVSPAKHLDWQEYQDTWTPNNGNNCPAYYVDEKEQYFLPTDNPSPAPPADLSSSQSVTPSLESDSITPEVAFDELSVDLEPSLAPDLEMDLGSDLSVDMGM